ncbi:NPP1 family protein [Kibdelosporangium philippinense]|uniref:NPP1 family protein n=1 Tax=Kibdelosporangium philippinense TaxID=211113 RepID=A0ABS8Z788_9PSEU|nr:NPP1 family protein [Kibdelosporangium philippinense]MCE7003751.1 NPP1 family protein [Kibdelosporangium philippinense]
MGRSMHRARKKRRAPLILAPLALAAVAGVVVAASAWADPPGALPSSAPDVEVKWQPAVDFDTDGCYNTPAIGPDGTLNPGLSLGGDVNGSCRDQSDLDNTNVYSRSKCNNGWCAHMYAYYFEKDQAALGPGSAGHRHDWEDIVVWVQDDQVKFVSVSQHASYETKSVNDVRFEDTHAKIVYHKDSVSTHAFRHANGNDEPPENHEGIWQRGPLVGWDNFPSGLRDTLSAADFGSATLKLVDGRFNDALAKAKPSEVPLDPNA